MKNSRPVRWFRLDLAILLAAAGALTPAALVAAQNPDSSTADSVAAGVRLAKAMVDSAVWDTASAGPCQRAKDTLCLRKLRDALVPKIAGARTYLAAGYASHDSTVWLMTVSVAEAGGEKLAQAGAYDQAYEWLDQLLTGIAHDSSGYLASQEQLKRRASFWYGFADALSLQEPYRRLVRSKSCEAKTLRDQIQHRIQRGMEALDYAGSSGGEAGAQIRNILGQYLSNIDRVTPAIQCRSF